MSDPLANLLARRPEPALGPGKPDEAARSLLEALTADPFLGFGPAHDRDMVRCCLAGLWLRHNFLDESHRISQDIETPSGSFWHAIMHRRELDYANSKYWFRRVGDYPIFPDLARKARDRAGPEPFPAAVGSWDPFAFVDLCDRAARRGGTAEALCLAVQEAEWDLLFAHCRALAVGPGPPEKG